MRREDIEQAMRRALELAHLSPEHNENPQVGCVLVAPDGRIVAEGWHLGAGTAHAEVDAISKLPSEWRGRERELTAVVTLEPCNHTGRTGPCADALIAAGIGAVTYGLADPGDDSAGGALTLRDAGVEVTGGVLKDEVQALLAPWLANRVHVTVKWAQTLDGRAAAADGTSQWITGQDARDDVHTRRAKADAILVGTGTLYADDPALTARTSNRASDRTGVSGDSAGSGATGATVDDLLVPAEEQPIPVVLGKRRIPLTARIRRHPALAAHGLEAPIHFDGSDLTSHLAELHVRGVRHLFVEGGPTIASAFIAAGHADDLLVYLSPSLLGGPKLAIGDLGIESMAGIKRLRVTHFAQLGPDLLIKASIEHPGQEENR